MSISKDRIEFEIRLNGSDREKLFSPFVRAFGVCFPAESSGYQKEGFDSLARFARIRCRPSQFARFLIYRDEAGCLNRFKELGAKIIKEQEIPQYIDVSKNGTKGTNFGPL